MRRIAFVVCLILAIAIAAAELVVAQSIIRTALVPPFRVSTNAQPALRLFLPCSTGGSVADTLDVSAKILASSKIVQMFSGKVSCGPAVQLIPLDVSAVYTDADKPSDRSLRQLDISIRLTALGFEQHHEYEVVDNRSVGSSSKVLSTRLLDGAFLDLYHFSDQEALFYPNSKLKNMTASDWDDQIRFMAQAGIRTGIIQALFFCNEYINHNADETCDNYARFGEAFYPSEVYPRQFPFVQTGYDRVEAILSAADKYGVNIFLGVGMWAWFDYGDQSLCWHQRVTRELYAKYGHHKSLYSFYVAGEMAGDFFLSYPPYYQKDIVQKMARFFAGYKKLVHEELNAAHMPISFACNSFFWNLHASQWQQVLQAGVDVLLPFGMARKTPPGWETLPSIIETSNKAGTRVWVDLEMFQEGPLNANGTLVPKTGEEMIAEIRKYDSVENVAGYEFTGHMDHPTESRVHLGGDKAAQLYVEYMKYYQGFLKA